ncbi:PAS domain S-box protein [Rhodocytophaga aerolata]|uniref:histidine kinase n=1 Tax=Rhodocytophaga aerolata TaxID=455078 RepID=A0ABT8RGV5_9BACT|nr:ATP-binding protein [Rhodocytophaga aerolata]MDO1451337.1 PAS domain S-box protein [Rhodocytophaga aerolata]
MSNTHFTLQEKQTLEAEVKRLQSRLQQVEENLEASEQKRQESEEIIEAIRTGAVDALTIGGEAGPQIFTLQGADHTYRILIEEMNEGALTLNEQALILYSNACFAQLVGLPLERVISCSFYDFLLPEDHARFGLLFKQSWSLAGKGEFVLKAAGNTLPISLSMNALTISTPPAVGMVLTNLSAEKQILAVESQVEAQNKIISGKEAELVKAKQREQEAEQFRIVLENIPQIAWTNLPSGEFIFYNSRWYTYTGLTVEQTKGWGWQSVVHVADLAFTLDAYRQALAREEEFVVENRYKRGSDGTYHWHLTRALPVRNQEGQITLWVGTATNIHEQKLSEQANQKLGEELAASNEELQAANEEILATNEELAQSNKQLLVTNADLDTFIYTASHDLKAPISNIEALLQALLRNLSSESLSSKRVQQITALMQESVERFKKTIGNLTEVVKLQKENSKELIWIDLSKVIREVSLDLEPLIVETQAKIEVEIANCPFIHFSEKNLRSVVYNLLSNAIKYRSLERVPQITISCEDVPSYHVLTFRDNGLGMESKPMSGLFTMFKRFHDHVEGTGIGLYMIKKMVENAGGKIEVESKLDVGSTFKVYFPN